MASRASNSQIQEMFREGNLIARALYSGSNIDNTNNHIGYNLEEFNQELSFLHSTKPNEGIHNNVTRNGSRNRSATLLTPNVRMDLFHDIGFLYDADKSTIRGYMFHDSVTTSGGLHDEFYNINTDKSKFEPVLSKKEFLDKYQSYRENTDNTSNEHTQYNEVLGNFFSESITGLVCHNDSIENKLKLLQLKHTLVAEKGLDLPIVMMNNGKIHTWNPTLNEISTLLDESKPLISKLETTGKSKEEYLQEFAKNLGFRVNIKDFNAHIRPDDITILHPLEFSSSEVVNYIHELTGIEKGGKFLYGIEGRLKETINARLERDGLPKISNLKTAIVSKEDIKDLVSTFDREIALKDKTHHPMDHKKLDIFVCAITEEMANRRDNQQKRNSIQGNEIRRSYTKDIMSNRIKEFFYKVASLFNEKPIAQKINRSI